MRCAWADNIIVVETDGYTRPCCIEPLETSRISPVNNGLIESWNHPILKKLRSNLENGFSKSTDPWCSRCRITEEAGEKSLRQNTEFLGNPGELKAVQFKLSNYCQLECAHCGPKLSSQHAKRIYGGNGIINAIDDIEPIIEDLRILLPQLEHIKFTGGEPWIHDQHWKILENLKGLDRSHCRLKYITNGISKPKEHLWEGWKSVNIQISVDGFKDSYEWFRRRSRWNKLVKNYKSLLKKGYNISIVYSVTPWTIQHYDDARKFFCDVPMYPNMIINPPHCNVKAMPNNIVELNSDTPFKKQMTGNKKTLEILKKWAINWDKKWNTEGMANKLYPWLFEDN